MPVTLAEETDDFAGYSVLIVPSAFRLGKKTWGRLTEFVRAGADRSCSPTGEATRIRRLREIFGVESLGDAGPSSRLTCRVAQEGVARRARRL